MVPINQNDLKELNVAFYKPTSEFYTIFGGSHSGKTTFLRDFIVKKEHLYLGGYPSNKKILFSNFIDQINKKFKLKQSSRFYDDFESILLLLNELEIREKVAIIIDNFQEIIKIDKEALNTLIKFWNKHLKHKPIFLICTFNTLQYNKAIFKNKIPQIHMEDFSFELLKNKPVLSPTDKFYLYSIFGASTRYYSFYSTKQELTKNVYQLTFQPASPFYNYGFEYLKKDFTEIGTFSAILYAIAIGNHKIGDIAEFIGEKSTYLTRYIQKLIDMMIIEKQNPLTNKTIHSKYGRYFIKNNFLRFWFCYIYPNRMKLDVKKHTTVLNELDKTLNHNILTPTYKQYISQLIQKEPSKYLGFEPNNIGPWWDNNSNLIDLVAYNNEQIVFINILWDTKENAMLQYNKLKEMSSHFSTTLKRNYIMISKNTYLNNFK